MKKFYDTNAILELLDAVLDEPFIISSETLKELELIKVSNNKTEELRYKARKACHLLDDNQNKFSVVIADNNNIYETIKKFDLSVSPDNNILASAYIENKKEPLIFVSNDIACKIIGRNVFGLNVENACENEEKLYKGYIFISGNTDYINNYMNNIDYKKWYINEYLIIEDTDNNKFTEMRFNGESFVPLKLPPSGYIKAKNSLQRCALDLMMNKDITSVAILGGYGSGKTYIATQMALYNVIEKGNQSKILGIRECTGEGKEVGFLKGSFEDKTGKFFKPIEQQLKGGEFELDNLIRFGTLETNIPFYLKGTTYNNTVMIVDEAEDLTESQIRLIGTRLGENSKVYFSGDYNQSLFNKTLNNPLVKMCYELKGNPMFGCVFLDEDVRSQTSKMFANLFKI